MENLNPQFSFNTLFTFNTKFNADSIEWCPHEPFKNVFVCGTYQLINNDEENDVPKKRTGCILLFSISPENGLILLQTLNTAAILDQKWCHNKINSYSILGIVNAEKQLEIYKLNPDLCKLELITYYELQNTVDEVLMLSLDWSTGKEYSDQPEIVCSDSKGCIHVFNFINNKLELLSSWEAHEYQAWIASFYYWDTDIVFTGGDDSLFQKFDRRLGNKAIVKNKSHGAGVTSIHSNPSKEFLVATGSYDSFVRLWDLRKIRSPLNELKVEGMVWRLKWDPFSYDFLLSACMPGGAHVINAKNCENLKLVDSYNEHKSIVYGADWSHLTENDINKYKFNNGNKIIGTCSFYDNLLCVSKFNID